MRALRVCGTQRPLWLGTCRCALVVAGNAPLWRAWWPRAVRRTSSSQFALRALVGFPNAVVPFPTLEACAPGCTGWLPGARGGRPRTGLIVPAAGPCRGRGAGLAPRRTRSGPRDGVFPGGSLRRRSWAACVDPVTDASGFRCRPSFDGNTSFNAAASDWSFPGDSPLKDGCPIASVVAAGICWHAGQGQRHARCCTRPACFGGLSAPPQATPNTEETFKTVKKIYAKVLLWQLNRFITSSHISCPLSDEGENEM